MKEVVFRWNDRLISAELGTKVTKQSLYGNAKTIVEKDGKVLSKGYLTPEGQILTRSEIDYAKLDPEGSIVDEVITEIEGQPATLTASIFDRENEITDLPMTELIGFNVLDVYPIEGLELPEGLYRTEFCYRKSYNPKEALILVKQQDLAFILVGERKQTLFVGQQVIYDFFDQESESNDDDELDFAMI